MDYIKLTLERAIAEGRRVRMIYQTGDSISERRFKPYELTEDSVIGYCYLRRAKRSFKLSGILSAQLIDERNQKNG